MPIIFIKTLLAAVFLATIISLPLFGQSVGSIPYQSQEVSEADGIPVLIKHLPDWEDVRQSTVFAKNADELKVALGDRPILDLIDFSAGTEAVLAQYDAGKLLIIEYGSPQGSFDADKQLTAALETPNDNSTAYRRTGNYNILVFDAPDMTAANALIDQVKYEKQIHWLGKNPFLITAERAFVMTTADIFLSTLIVIVIGIILAILSGLTVGFVYFQMRERRRLKIGAFSDAGGLTRLNLDGFTGDAEVEHLLKD